MISRRNFVGKAAKGIGIAALMPSLTGCVQERNFSGIITGPNAALGHRLRTMDFPEPTKTISTGVVIVGGGVAGLSAGRFLKKYTDDFLLLELEDTPGGNSVGGSNSVSAFPWGAHYLPLPGNNDPELTTFLRECNVITGFAAGKPVFNEYYLCHDPKERLYINHFWQDSIIPHEGVPGWDRDEIQRFLALMHEYKQRKGHDEKPAFAIPLEMSSNDDEFLKLDTITADQFLAEHNYRSQYLRWYVNYCCADDYGSSLRQTSAWAMVHYFASRRSHSANAPADAVLTWPEGNYWLIKQLENGLTGRIRPRTLAYSINVLKDKVEVLAFDAAENMSQRIIADKVIMATPQFINKRILRGVHRPINYDSFHYAPWMVANLTLSASLSESHGEQLCWDNVIYGNDSLGYVNAMHQQVGRERPDKVITYYKPLTDGDALSARMHAYATTYSDWKSQIVSELTLAHRDINDQIKEMDVWIWGHGMIRPSPGFIWGEDRQRAMNNIDDRIYFAHSDISGISIFEEAFYQGHKNAREVLGI